MTTLRFLNFTALALIAVCVTHPAKSQEMTQGPAISLNAQSMKEAAQSAKTRLEPLKNLRARAAETEILRTGFVMHGSAMSHGLSDEERRAFTFAFGPMDRTNAAQLSWFMASAVTAVSSESLSALYSPLSQTWLIIKWSNASGAAKVSEVYLAPNAVVSGDPDQAVPNEASIEETVVKTYAQAMKNIRLLGDPKEEDRLLRSLADNRVLNRQKAYAAMTPALASAAIWYQDPAKAKSWRANLINLAQGPARRLPQKVRETMMPVATYATESGEILVLVSSQYPDYLLMQDLSDAMNKSHVIDLRSVKISSSSTKE